MTREERIVLSKMNKKRAWFSMSGVSLLLIASSLVSYAMSFGISLLMGKYSPVMQNKLTAFLISLGINKMRAFSAVRQFFASGVLTDLGYIVITIFAMVLPGMIYAKMNKQTSNEFFNVKGKLVKNFVSMFCLCQLITTATSIFAGAIGDFIAPSAPQAGSGVVLDNGLFALLMSVISTCVLVPVTEEFLFRGVIFSQLRRHGLLFAIVGSATLFGVAHSEPVQSVYAFSFGIISAMLVSVTENIKTSIVFHAMNNLVTTLLEYFMKNLSETNLSIVYSVYYIFVLFFSFVGIYHLIKKDGFLDKLKIEHQQNDGGLLEYAGMKEIMCVPLIIYILLYAASFALGVFA